MASLIHVETLYAYHFLTVEMPLAIIIMRACMHASLCSEFDHISLAFVCVNIILCPSSKTNQCHRSMFRAQILSCTLLSRTKPTLSVLLGYSGNESRLLRYSVRNVGSLFCERVRLSVVVLSVPSSMSWVSSRLVRYVTA